MLYFNFNIGWLDKNSSYVLWQQKQENQKLLTQGGFKTLGFLIKVLKLIKVLY